MNAVDVLRLEARHSYAWLESIVKDVSPEQAAWLPPGTANSIAAHYAHIVVNTDVDVTRYFHGSVPIVETNDWIARLRLDPDDLDGWDTYHGIDWELLREYGRLVHNHIIALTDELTQAELDRKFQMIPESLGVWSGMDIYSLHCGRHVWMHGGEIACLKGLQGIKGYVGYMPEHLAEQGAKND